MYDKNNIFAKIIRGEIPATRVAESEFALAFNDAHPVAKTHILVVPKGEYENAADFIANASAAEQSDFWSLVLSVAESSGIRDNFRLQANTGTHSGQTVFHFHVHLMSGMKCQASICRPASPQTCHPAV